MLSRRFNNNNASSSLPPFSTVLSDRNNFSNKLSKSKKQTSGLNRYFATFYWTKVLYLILCVYAFDISVYVMNNFINVSMTVGKYNYHGGLINSIVSSYRLKLRKSKFYHENFGKDLKLCHNEHEKLKYIELNISTPWLKVLRNNGIIKLKSEPLSLTHHDDDARSICTKNHRCVGYNYPTNEIIVEADFPTEDFLYIRKKHRSSTFCQSINAISYDLKYVPIVQYSGVSLSVLQKKCRDLNHCIGFSSVGWLYGLVSPQSREIVSTTITIKSSHVVTKLKNKFPGLYGNIQNRYSPDYREYLVFRNYVEKAKENDNKYVSVIKCYEKDLITRMHTAGNEDEKSVFKPLLVVAWTDIYLEQGNAVEFLRKMMPQSSMFYNAKTGEPIKSKCKAQHKVISGDTLWDISQNNNVKLSTLIDANKDETFVKSGILQIGDTVCIPNEKTTEKSEPQLLIAHISHKNDNYAVYITVNRYCMDVADALLFNAPFLNRSPPPFDSHRIHPDQIWVMMSWEGPRFSSDRALESPHIMNKHFALTATRSSKSSCPMTKTIVYNKSWKRPSFESIRRKEILYLYSNCKTASLRDDFAAKLSAIPPKPSLLNSNVIPLKSFGKCLKNSDWPEDLKSVDRNSKGWEDAKAKLSERFLFEFVAMNSLCESFLDEKFQLSLKSGTIPIVLAAPNLLEFAPIIPLPIHASPFIMVNYLPSIRSLQQHLMEIANNKTLYKSYGEWYEKAFDKSNVIYRNPSRSVVRFSNNKNNHDDQIERNRESNSFRCLFDKINDLKERKYNFFSNRIKVAAPEQCIGSWKELWIYTWRNRLRKYSRNFIKIRLKVSKEMKYAFHFYYPKDKANHKCFFVVNHRTNKVEKVKKSNVKVIKKKFDFEDIDSLPLIDKMTFATIIAELKYGWNTKLNVGKLY